MSAVVKRVACRDCPWWDIERQCDDQWYLDAVADIHRRTYAHHVEVSESDR